MKKIKFLGVLTLSLLTLAACGGSTEKNDNNSVDKAKEAQKSNATETKKEDSKKESSDEIFKDNTLTSQNAVVKYTGSEKGADYNGKPILYTFFTITNKNKEAKNAQLLLLEYVGFTQNLGSTTKRLDFGMSIDSPHKDKLDILQQDINPDGTVEMAYVSSIEDESKPVTITFKDGMMGKEAGKIDVDVK